MTNLITIHNVETGEIVEREATANELAQFEADAASETARKDAEAAKAAARQAILDRLGLTAEEAALLLGSN
jgi:predicted metal-dependent HD superfamily phosphohydrolase